MNTTTKIDSPFAQLDGNILKCKLCCCQVKNTGVWTAHVNGKQHIKKLLELKSKKTQLNSLKRPSTENGSLTKRVKTDAKEKAPGLPKHAQIPVDFFDQTASNKVEKRVTEIFTKPKDEDSVVNSDTKTNTEKPSTSAIPEGFFDDKKSDAKARNVELKDPLDDEWLRFQKEIKQTQNVIDAIVDEDDEKLNTERTIDEIDEEIRGWAKVNELEKKVEQVIVPKNTPKIQPKIEQMDEDDDVEGDITDELIDWRSKQLWK